MKTKAKPSMYACFSAFLKAGRISSGLTQGQVARSANVDVRTVRRWERGVSLPSRSQLSLLEALHALPAGCCMRLIRLRQGLPEVPGASERVTDLTQ